MARLRTLLDSDDEFPELATLLAKGAVPFKKQEPQFSRSVSETQSSKHRHIPSTSPLGKTDTPKQRPLKIEHVNSLLLSLTKPASLAPEKAGIKIRSSPQRPARKPQKQDLFLSTWENFSEVNDALSDHMSDFIVPDSDSDSEEDPVNSAKQRPLRSPSQYHDPKSIKHVTSKPSSQHHPRAKHSARSSRSFLEEYVEATTLPAKQGDCLLKTGSNSVADSETFENSFGNPNSTLRLCELKPPNLLDYVIVWLIITQFSSKTQIPFQISPNSQSSRNTSGKSFKVKAGFPNQKATHPAVATPTEHRCLLEPGSDQRLERSTFA